MLTFQPIVDPAYVNVYALDISDRKRTEAALRTSEAKYRRLYESMRDACVTVTMDGRIVECNPAYQEMHGYTLDELRAISYHDLTPAKWHAAETAMIAEQVLPRGYSDTYEKEHYHRNGSVFPVEVRSLLLKDEAGNPRGMWAIVRDISDRKRAEEALRKKEEEFRQAQKLEAVGALAGGMAHEFNNLLQAIRAFTQFALDGLLPEDPRYQDLQQVLKASERAANLTRQLLGFSRRQQFHSTNVRLNEILVDLEKMLRPLIGEDVELKMDLGESVGVLAVDSTMIQQVVMNLCINARDAMPSGGTLQVKTENVVVNAEDCASHVDSRPGSYVRLTVSDTGEGIPPDVMQRIFEPFFTTKEVGKGTGLRLSMVYGVVHQHGGTIRVRSEPGQGAAFEIYLPAAEAASQPAEPEPSGAGATGVETILVAEDDPMVRTAVVRALTEAGYSVLSAGDGDEAVRMFAEHATAIRMVLLDMVMPKMGGRKAHRQIAEINPNTPVVYCSGYDSGLATLEAAEAARLCVLEKPVDRETVLATVRKVLDRSAACLIG